MAEERFARLNLYRERLTKELSIPEHEVRDRARWDMTLLSENYKCGVSIDLPILNCRPSRACAQVCYASQGRQYYRAGVVKSLAISRMLIEDPERASRKVATEAAGRTVRLAGSGDILPAHRQFVDCLGDSRVDWWGFTRRIETHCLLPRLMFSFDQTSPSRIRDYMEKNVPVRRRAYLRRPCDPAPETPVAVIFPVHGPRTRYVDYVPEHRSDCPAIRGRIKGCWECRRCY